MPIYKVTDCHLKHDGTHYAPGDAIELEEGKAFGLHVEPAPNEVRPGKGKRKGGDDATA